MVFLFILGIFIFLFLFSNIKIEIQNLHFSSETKPHINNSYHIKCKLNILQNMTIAKLTITDKKLKKWNFKEKIKKVDFKIIQNKNKVDNKIIKAIKEINIQLEKIDFIMELGTKNACITSFIIPAISTAIAVILREKIKKYENQIFLIKPVYQDRNIINICFSGIFQIKMIHIINIIYILNKKGKVKKHERTSNRRSYDYSYE